MKKLLSILLALTLMLSSGIVSVFAEDESHVHVWSDWITEEESTCDEHGSDYRFCEECGQYEYREVPFAPHEWGDWKVIRKATPYKEGKKERYCENCDETQTEKIAKRKLTANQKKAVGVVNTYLKAARSYKVNKMNSCFKKGSKKYGYPVKEINGVFKKYNKKIKWSMVDVTGKGKTIKVKVKVTRPDFYTQAYNSFYETFKWYILHPNVSDSKLTNKLFGKYRTKVKNCTKKTSTDTVVFTIVKSGKKWKIKTQTRTIVDIATAFYWIGSDNATDDFLREYS